MSSVERIVDTVVVGAGISGLAYAHGLGPAADVLVLEASARAGGLMRTEHVDGLGSAVHYEWGPEALQDNAPETRALLGELGLEPVLAAPDAARRYVLRTAPALRSSPADGAFDADARVLDAVRAFDAFAERDDGSQAYGATRTPQGELVPVPTGPGSFLRSPLLSRRAKLRALTEPLRSRHKALDGSVADFARHRLGAEVLDWLLDPFVSGVFAGDVERLSLRAAFPALHAMVREHGSIMGGMKARAAERRRTQPAGAGGKRGLPSLLSLEGGLGDLPRALAAALGERLALSSPVARVRPEGDGWRVTRAVAGEGVQGPEIAARRLVLAVPAPGAAAILAQDLPQLSQPLAEVTAESIVSVAHLWRREDVAHSLDAFGYLVPSKLGLGHLGTLFSSSIHPGRCDPELVLLRTFLGGAHHPGLVDEEADVAREIVAREVGAVLGLRSEPLWSSVVAWRGALPRYDLDHPARQDTIDTLLERQSRLSILGNHRRGISVNALIETARRLAREHRGAAGGDDPGGTNEQAG